MSRTGYQKIETTRGVRYRYQWTDPTTGARRSLTAVSVAELELTRRRVEQVRGQLAAGQDPALAARDLPGAIDPRRQTIGEVWAAYLATRPARLRPKYASYWARNVDLMVCSSAGEAPLSAQPVWACSRVVMAAWLAAARTSGGRTGRGRAWKTVRAAWDLLAASLTMAEIAAPWGSWRPTRGAVEQLRPPRQAARSWDEIVLMARAAREDDERARARGRLGDGARRVLFGALTGLRNAEIAGLGWDDLILDVAPERMNIRHQACKGWWQVSGDRPRVPPKGRQGTQRTRTQLLEAYAVQVLMAQRAELERLGWYRPEGPVFPAADGTWRRTGYAIGARSLRRWAERAGIDDWAEWVPHRLRHTTASLTAAITGDIRLTQARLGHADAQTTMAYVHDLTRGMAPPVLSRTYPMPVGLVETTVQAPPEGDPWALGPRPGRLAEAPGVDTVTSDRVWEAAERARRARRAERAESDRPLEELAREWLATPERERRDARGRGRKEPAAVALRARRAYTAGYVRARGAGAPKPECAAAGRRARRAFLARWARALEAAARASAAE